MSALNPQQFGTRTGANAADSSANGQASARTGAPTTTTVTVKGSAPAISTRSS